MSDDKKKRFSFNVPSPKDIELRSLLQNTEPPKDNQYILPLILWYLKKEVILNASPHTEDAKFRDLQKFINFFIYHHPEGLLKDWDRPFTNLFIVRLKQDYEVSTIERIIATLSNFATFLERKRVIDHDDNPVRKAKLPRKTPRKPRVLMAYSSKGEIIGEGKEIYEKLIEAARSRLNEKKGDREFPYRDIAIIELLYHSGLRATEICDLTRSQIEHHRKTKGIIFRKVQCKGRKERDVYIRDVAAEALNNYLEYEVKKDSGPLFVNCFGKKLSRYGLRRILYTIGKKSKLGEDDIAKFEISPHRFRHLRAYSLFNDGFSESEVAEELGHSSTKYVGIYIQRSDDERFERLSHVE